MVSPKSDRVIFQMIMRVFHAIFTLALLSLASPLFASLPVVVNNGPASCTGGLTYVHGGSVANTDFDTVYDSECYFESTTTVAVNDPDIISGNSYTVYLHFAEIWFGDGNAAFGEGDGARIFHVNIEGNRVLENFDIHATVGPRNAIAFKYDVMASENGGINITFTNVVQHAKISAIEIHPLGGSSTMETYTGVYDLNASPFPVEWAHVNADAEGNEAVITWQTAWESNNRGFEVQINGSGNSYETIGFVEGIGTTNEVSDYSFTTGELMPGSYQIRLKQIDFDGRISVSPTMELAIGFSGALSFLPLRPNPANFQTEWSVETSGRDHLTVTLLSPLGQTLDVLYEGQTTEAGIMRQTFDVSSLTPGVYFLHLSANGHNDVQRLVVSR